MTTLIRRTAETGKRAIDDSIYDGIWQTPRRMWTAPHYLIEIRSLNNKYFKSQLRLPEELQGLEAELESAVSRRLNRGTVVVTVKFSDTSEKAAATINSNALRRYFDQLLQIKGIDHDAARVDIGSLLELPGVVVTDTGEERLEQATMALMKLLKEACDRVMDMRSREGKDLHDDLLSHCNGIKDHLDVIQRRVPKILEQYQQRFAPADGNAVEGIGRR